VLTLICKHSGSSLGDRGLPRARLVSMPRPVGRPPPRSVRSPSRSRNSEESTVYETGWGPLSTGLVFAAPADVVALKDLATCGNSALAKELSGLTSEELQKRLNEATPDPLAVQFKALSPLDRIRAVSAHGKPSTKPAELVSLPLTRSGAATSALPAGSSVAAPASESTTAPASIKPPQGIEPSDSAETLQQPLKEDGGAGCSLAPVSTPSSSVLFVLLALLGTFVRRRAWFH
jgi:hypothetical protein